MAVPLHCPDHPEERLRNMFITKAITTDGKKTGGIEKTGWFWCGKCKRPKKITIDDILARAKTR